LITRTIEATTLSLSFFYPAHTVGAKENFQSALRPSISIRLGTNTEEH